MMTPGGIVRQLVTRITFSIDTKRLTQFRNIITGIKKSLNSVVSGIKFFIAGVASLGIALLGLVGSAVGFSNVILDNERNLKVLSRTTGLNRTQLESLRIAFNTFGVKTETFQNAISHIGNGLNEAALGFGSLAELSTNTGISLTKTNGELKTTDELLADYIEYARKIDNPALLNVFGKLAFGTSDPEQIASLISKSSKEIQAATASASELQASISSEDRQELDAFQKNFVELKALLYKFATEITLGVLPYINRSIEGFVTLGKRVRDLRQYFTDLAKSISKMLEPIMDFFASIKDKVAPEGSKTGKVIKFGSEVIDDYLGLFNGTTIDKISRNAFGVPLFKDPPMVNNITVNTTLPPGTTSEQARYLQDMGEQAGGIISDRLERETRQMRNNNALPAY